VIGDGGRLTRLDSSAARRWALATRAAFATHRAEIDDLNVFPVPDRDTGTNLYLTLNAALQALERALPESDPDRDATLAGDTAVLAQACLVAARGNSGVILSQLLRGLSEVIGEASTAGIGGMVAIDGPTLALALRRASDRASASVTKPVEGTILSVAAAAASAAELAVSTGDNFYAVARASLAAAREALAGTTAQLPSLARAGVVDAGGMGYVLVLEALERVIAGGVVTGPRRAGGERPHQVTGWAGAPADDRGDMNASPHLHDVPGEECGQPNPGGPAYEVMFLLSHTGEEAVSLLRDRLAELGESVLVVGGDDVWNVHVHVHTEDVGTSIQAGVEAGWLYRLTITHLGDQDLARTPHPAPAEVAVVACAAGAGLADVFSTAGALVVFERPGHVSAARLLDVIRAAGPQSVIVVPNDPDTKSAAEVAALAAKASGLEVHVAPLWSAVQALAALAVFEPAASVQVNLAAMSGAAAATRTGEVAVAHREARTSAGVCHPGDVLGTVDGHITVIGSDPSRVGAEVVTQLLAGGGELLTILIGADGGPDLAAAVAASARDVQGDLEVSIIGGGQGTYALLIGVE